MLTQGPLDSSSYARTPATHTHAPAVRSLLSSRPRGAAHVREGAAPQHARLEQQEVSEEEGEEHA